MAVRILFAQSRACRNSLVALLGALEREALLDACEARPVPGERIVDEYGRAMARGDRCIVAFSISTHALAQCAASIAALRSMRRPGDLVIAGGPHPTAADESVLSMGVDVVFRGEADSSFPCFVGAVLGARDWRTSPGLSYVDGDRVVRTPAAEAMDIDRVRSTCRQMRQVAPLELTRGCPYACRFCQTPKLWGSRPRHRSPESVLEEVAHYRSFVRLLSPNAFGYRSQRRGEPNGRAIVGLLEAIRARHPALHVHFGVFPSEVRPEYVRRDLVRAIRPLVANRYLAIGAQSGSDRVLDRARRSHRACDVLTAAEAILDEGMGILVDILFGLPGETPEDVRQTRRLMERIDAWGGRFRVHRFRPLPGTDFADAPAARDLDPETEAFLSAMTQRRVVEGDWQT